MSPVAEARVWEEHLAKIDMQQRKHTHVGVFNINPYNMRNKTLAESKISKRPDRFLDREAAALDAINGQLRRRLQEVELRESHAGGAQAQLQQQAPATAEGSTWKSQSKLPGIAGRGGTASSRDVIAAHLLQYDTPAPQSAKTALPALNDADSKHRAALQESLARQLISVTQVPTKRYKVPQTEAQELGWNSKPLYVPSAQNQAKFKHGLVSCDVTRFSHYAVGRKL
jgi:hypothetical protein